MGLVRARDDSCNHASAHYRVLLLLPLRFVASRFGLWSGRLVGARQD